MACILCGNPNAQEVCRDCASQIDGDEDLYRAAEREIEMHYRQEEEYDG